MNTRLRYSVMLLSLALAFVSASAATPDDALLAGAAARLDVKGAEVALRRGAKATEPLSHPYSPNVKRTPIQFVLSALIGSDEADAPQRAERLLRMLFKAGAKLSGDRDELFSPIVYGYERIVTLLLDHGANPHARIYGYTPAELSIKHGQQRLLPIFYVRGVPKVDEETKLQIQFVEAASSQRLDDMRAAYVGGARVDAPDPAGLVAIVQLFSTPLREPAGYDSLKWLLFEAKADPKAIEFGEERISAIHRVIERNSFKERDYFTTAAIVVMLIERGSDVSAQDYRGRTPLHYAADTGNYLAAEALLKNSAKVSTRDTLRRTPLDLAKSRRVIELLKEYGARE